MYWSPTIHHTWPQKYSEALFAISMTFSKPSAISVEEKIESDNFI